MKTEVVFRKFKGEVIALFPYIINDRYGNVMSYAHLGQHSGADYKHIVRNSTLASKKEFKGLRNELTKNVGYKLNVIKRINGDRYLKALRESYDQQGI